MVSSATKDIPQAQLNEQVPASFTVDTQGHVRLAQVYGTFPGPKPFLIQLGYQVTGQANSADIPPLPDLAQVTTMSKARFDFELLKVYAKIRLGN